MIYEIIDIVIDKSIRPSDYMLHQINNMLSLKRSIGLYNRFTIGIEKRKYLKNGYRITIYDHNRITKKLDIRIIHQTSTRRHDIIDYGEKFTYHVDKDLMKIFSYWFGETILKHANIPTRVRVAHPKHGMCEVVLDDSLFFSIYFSTRSYNVDNAVYLIDGFNNKAVLEIEESIKREKVLYQNDKMELERRHKERLSMLEKAKNEIINNINI